MGETFHADIDTAIQDLVIFGGGLTLWSDEDDVFMTVDPEQRSIAVGVLHDLRPGRDVQLSNSLELLFKVFCTKLRPKFGFVSEDGMLDPAIHRRPGQVEQHLFDEVDRQQAPSVLFWLNYFSEEYLEAVDPGSFRHLIVRPAEPLGDGVLLYLADAPWNERVGILQADGRYT
jgi:hypothetical protein